MKEEFDWKWFVEKLLCYIALVFIDLYFLVPNLEKYLMQLSVEQMANQNGVIEKMNMINIFIDVSYIALIIIPIILFWYEIKYLFDKIVK